MSNNRDLISDPTLVSQPQHLARGFSLPGLHGRFMVDEGWCAVITVGGVFKEILEPGQYHLDRYNRWQDVKVIRVDRRVKTLTVSTIREFTIALPVPIEINLDLSIEYRVADPRRVALEISTPLTSLYDRVIQAMRTAIVHATIDEIRTQGEGIARAVLQHLQAIQLPTMIGVEVLDVIATTIKATDAGSDALAAQQLKELTLIRNWQLDAIMLQQLRVTSQWLMVHRPEIYQQILAGNQVLLKELIDKKLLDPASVDSFVRFMQTRASGEHSIAIGGVITDSTMVTGDAIAGSQAKYNVETGSAKDIAIGDKVYTLTQDRSGAESTTEGYAVARLQSTLDNQRALLNRNFQLLAGVTSEITAGLSGTRFTLLSQQETAVINVTVRAEDMDIKPGWVQQVVFTRTHEPSLAEFELTPRATGHKIIGIEYYHEQHWLASLELPVEIVDNAEMEPVPRILE